jgi:hypothetical protein
LYCILLQEVTNVLRTLKFVWPLLRLPMLPARSQNRHPDCLYLKLKGKPLASAQNQVDLYLTINFSEQWQELLGGRVKVGLKGGELRLKVFNGTLPYESRQLTGVLALSVPKKRTLQTSHSAQTEIEVKLPKEGTPAPVALQPSIKASSSSAQTHSRADEFQFIACQIMTKGAEESPAWEFAVETGTPVLKGLLKNTLLGTLHIDTKPCRVEALFQISKRDLYFTNAEGLWPSDISQNKRAVLERMIALHLLAAKYQPYLSRTELQYG